MNLKASLRRRQVSLYAHSGTLIKVERAIATSTSQVEMAAQVILVLATFIVHPLCALFRVVFGLFGVYPVHTLRLDQLINPGGRETSEDLLRHGMTDRFA
jgi:hypothetical protein